MVNAGGTKNDDNFDYIMHGVLCYLGGILGLNKKRAVCGKIV